jgi:hypothetical protein
VTVARCVTCLLSFCGDADTVARRYLRHLDTHKIAASIGHPCARQTAAGLPVPPRVEPGNTAPDPVVQAWADQLFRRGFGWQA